jgi:hypothetical protein
MPRLGNRIIHGVYIYCGECDSYGLWYTHLEYFNCIKKCSYCHSTSVLVSFYPFLFNSKFQYLTLETSSFL